MRLWKGAHSDTDSSGYSYAHTGAYSHSDTDSSDYQAPAFMASDYMGTWYSKDGLVTLSIDDLTLKSVTFTFSQAGDNAGTEVSEASDTAKVAGNAAKLSFTDSWGNQVRGNMTFDQGKLYLRLNTASAAEGAGVTPKVDGVLTREKAASVTQAPSVTPADNTDKTDLSSRIIYSRTATADTLQMRICQAIHLTSWNWRKMRFMPDMAGNL